MPKTTTGKRSAKVGVQIVQDGNTIEMRFDEHNIGRITFKASTGQSGPKAFEKLSKILDLEGSAEGLTT